MMTFRSIDRLGARVRARRLPAIRRSLAALATVAAAGCASGGGGAVRDTVWREDLGRTTGLTLGEGVAKIAQKHGLRIYRQELGRPRELYFELAWVPRAAVAAEEARGVTNARNRIVVRGRLLERGMAAGDRYYRVTWEVENEVTSVTATSWHPDVIPEEVVEQFRPVFRDLAMEVRTGIRR